MPSELIQAILDGNEAKVREFAATRPELLEVRSETGSLPVNLALRARRVMIATALLRAGGRAERAPSFGELLIDYVNEVCDRWLCAHWIGGIERRLWKFMTTGLSPWDADTELIFLRGKGAALPQGRCRIE